MNTPHRFDCSTGLKSGSPGTSPLVIFQGLQRDAFEQARLHSSENIWRALENCRSILQMARLSGWPVAHVLWRERDEFDPCGDAWRPIEGFEPTACEMTFITNGPSAFSSPQFRTMIISQIRRSAILVGIEGTMSCLSTLVDAQERHIRLTYINDACFLPGLAPAENSLESAQDITIARFFGDVMETAHFLKRYAPSDLMLKLTETRP